MREPQLSFQNALLKVEWAEQHIENLNRFRDAFIEANRNATVMEAKNASEGVSIGVDNPGVPPGIPLLAGDIVHNLRASLDVCWSGLYRWKDIKSKRGKPTFPVADNRKGLEGTLRNNEICASLPDAERTALKINAHADFDDGGNRPIIVLNRLSNWEKHNLLIIAVRQATIPQFTVNGGPFRGITFHGAQFTGEPPEGGAHIHFRPFDPSTRLEVEQKGDTAAEIVFGEHDFVELEPVVPLLINLAQATHQAVKAFIEAFPDN